MRDKHPVAGTRDHIVNPALEMWDPDPLWMVVWNLARLLSAGFS
jgi:hypothetical protein